MTLLFELVENCHSGLDPEFNLCYVLRSKGGQEMIKSAKGRIKELLLGTVLVTDACCQVDFTQQPMAGKKPWTFTSYTLKLEGKHYEIKYSGWYRVVGNSISEPVQFCSFCGKELT